MIKSYNSPNTLNSLNSPNILNSLNSPKSPSSTYVTLQTLLYAFRYNANIVGADAYINQPIVNIDAHQPDFTIIVYNAGRCGHRPLQNTLIKNNL